MTLPVALAADLDALSAAIDDPDVDIVDILAELGDAAATGVNSYLGLTLAVVGGSAPFQLSTMSGQGQRIGTSVVIPVIAIGAAMPHGAVTTLVLYAGDPGAFIDMTADLAWITGRDMSEFRLDQHLTPPQLCPASGSLRARSTVNQAIGVLIGRGRSPQQAAHELVLLAAGDRGDIVVAAAWVLAELAR